MRILFSDIKNVGAGKGFFLQALAEELAAMGEQIVFAGDEHDIALCNIRIKHDTSKPRVVRFDGVYHDTGMDYKGKNESLRYAGQIAKKVICQSEYGRRMVKAYLGVPDEKITVILNGTKLDVETVGPQFTAKHNFIAVAKWRPHKRLESTIKAFLLMSNPGARLHIIGRMSKGMTDDIYKYRSDKVIFYDHVCDRKILLGYMQYATALIHLCWFDCCPNSVVEAVAQKCPVICSNEGGTHEIVRPSGGTVLNLDMPYNLLPVDLYHPPKVDLNAVAEAMQKIIKTRPEISNEHVDIKRTARQYLKVFQSALEEK